MAFCSPKAIDFIAIDRNTGKQLPWNDPQGLAARWRAADFASKCEVNLIRNTPAVEREMAAAAARATDSKIVVKVAL